MSSSLISAATKVLIGRFRNVAHAMRAASEKSDRRGFVADWRPLLSPELRQIFAPAPQLWIPVPGPRILGLRYYLDEFLLAGSKLIELTLRPLGDRIAEENANDGIRDAILAALFGDGPNPTPRSPHPAALTAAEMIRLGVVHRVDQERVARWIEQERGVQSVCDEILSGYSARSGFAVPQPSSEQLDAEGAKREKQTSESTRPPAPTNETPASSPGQKESGSGDPPRSDDRPERQLARILRLAIGKEMDPDLIADTIEEEWTPESDPEEFVRTMRPDRWSAKPEDEDRSPTGELCAMWDDREQGEQFRVEFEDLLTDELQRITDTAKLRSQLEAERLEREVARKQREQRELVRLAQEVKEAVRGELERQERDREAKAAAEREAEQQKRDEEERKRRKEELAKQPKTSVSDPEEPSVAAEIFAEEAEAPARRSAKKEKCLKLLDEFREIESLIQNENASMNQIRKAKVDSELIRGVDKLPDPEQEKFNRPLRWKPGYRYELIGKLVDLDPDTVRSYEKRARKGKEQQG